MREDEERSFGIMPYSVSDAIPCTYALTWIYLQSVAPELQTESDWDTIKYLIRS